VPIKCIERTDADYGKEPQFVYVRFLLSFYEIRL